MFRELAQLPETVQLPVRDPRVIRKAGGGGAVVGAVVGALVGDVSGDPVGEGAVQCWPWPLHAMFSRDRLLL